MKYFLHPEANPLWMTIFFDKVIVRGERQQVGNFQGPVRKNLKCNVPLIAELFQIEGLRYITASRYTLTLVRLKKSSWRSIVPAVLDKVSRALDYKGGLCERKKYGERDTAVCEVKLEANTAFIKIGGRGVPSYLIGEFPFETSAAESSLARALFRVSGVEFVNLRREDVVLGLGSLFRWDDVIGEVLTILREHLVQPGFKRPWMKRSEA